MFQGVEWRSIDKSTRNPSTHDNDLYNVEMKHMTQIDKLDHSFLLLDAVGFVLNELADKQFHRIWKK